MISQDWILSDKYLAQTSGESIPSPPKLAAAASATFRVSLRNFALLTSPADMIAKPLKFWKIIYVKIMSGLLPREA